MEKSAKFILFGVLLLLISVVAVWNHIAQKDRPEGGMVYENSNTPTTRPEDESVNVQGVIGSGNQNTGSAAGRLPGQTDRQAPVTTQRPGQQTVSVPSLAQGDTEYIVQSGDNFWSIAKKVYGDRNKWKTIQDANTNVKPESLRIGQKLRIPGANNRPIDDVVLAPREVREGMEVNPVSLGTLGGQYTYTVQSGDNPWKIAEKFYGDGNKNAKIMAANPGVDPNRLKVGQTLVIPDYSPSVVSSR